MDNEAHPGDRPALCPRRIVIRYPRRELTLKHSFEITDCVDCRESGFAEVNLIAVFEGTEQFHAVERSKIQIGVETGGLQKIRRWALGDAGNQVRQWGARHPGVLF